MNRRNLDVVTRANVTGVRFDGRRATGVDYRTWRGERRSVTAGEVILCGGAFNSPQLLQVSGVGDPDHLRSVGVPVVHDLPGVGDNLQDHLEVYVQHAATQPVSLNPLLAWRHRPWIGLQWIFRRGPGTTNHFEGGGFVRSNDDVAYPNLMFHFLPIAVRYDGSRPPAAHGYQVHVGPMYSDVRGSVRITSPDAQVKPALRFNYLSTPNDRREWVEAIHVARHILGQPAFAPFDAGEVSPGPGVGTDEEILDWVAARRRDRPASVVHVRDGNRRAVGGRSAHDARARHRRAACRRRLGDAVRHQRQHLRPGDDDRREGRRPDPRQHAAGPDSTCRSTATTRRRMRSTMRAGSGS